MGNRNIDAEIARRVLGWSETDISNGIVGAQNALPLPRYSTNLAAAWSIVARYRDSLDFALSYIQGRSVYGDWRASFCRKGAYDWVEEAALTAELAICRAILKFLRICDAGR